jgi:hypothetical protein
VKASLDRSTGYLPRRPARGCSLVVRRVRMAMEQSVVGVLGTVGTARECG